MVNDQIELKVLRIKGKQVHIGIDAPADTAIHRREVWLRIQEEGNAEAPAAAPAAPPAKAVPAPSLDDAGPSGMVSTNAD